MDLNDILNHLGGSATPAQLEALAEQARERAFEQRMSAAVGEAERDDLPAGADEALAAMADREREELDQAMLDAIDRDLDTAENDALVDQLDPSVAGYDHTFQVWSSDEIAAIRFTDAAADQMKALAPVQSTTTTTDVKTVDRYQEEVMYTFSATIDDLELAADDFNGQRAFTVNGEYTNNASLLDRLTSGFMAAYLSEPPLVQSAQVVLGGSATFDLGNTAEGVDHSSSHTGGSEPNSVVNPNTTIGVRAAIRRMVSRLIGTVANASQSDESPTIYGVTLNISLDGVRTGAAGMPDPAQDRVAFSEWYQYWKLALGGCNPEPTDNAAGRTNVSSRKDLAMFVPCNTDNRCFYHALLRRAARCRGNANDPHRGLSRVKDEHYGRLRTMMYCAGINGLDVVGSRHSGLGDAVTTKLCSEEESSLEFPLRASDACTNNRPVSFADVFEAAIRMIRPIVTFALDDDMLILPEFSIMWWELQAVMDGCPEDMPTRDKLTWFCENVRPDGQINTSRFYQGPSKYRFSVFRRVSQRASSSYTADTPCRPLMNGHDPTALFDWNTVRQDAMSAEESGERGAAEIRRDWLASKKRTVALGYSSAWKHFMLFLSIESVGIWLMDATRGRADRYPGATAWRKQSEQASIKKTTRDVGCAVCHVCGAIALKFGPDHSCYRRRCNTCRQSFSTKRRYHRHFLDRRTQRESGRTKACKVCFENISLCCHAGHQEDCERRARKTQDGTVQVKCSRCKDMYDQEAIVQHRSVCQGDSANPKRCRECKTKHMTSEPCRVGAVEKTSRKKWDSTEVYVWDIESYAEGEKKIQRANYIHVIRVPKPEVTWERDPSVKPRAQKPVLCNKNREQFEATSMQQLRGPANSYSFSSLSGFLEWFHQLDHNAVFVAHNAKGYDSYLLRTAALECGYNPSFICSNGQKIDSMGFSREVEHDGEGKPTKISYKFIDSLNWFGKPLAALPKMLGIRSAQAAKGLFPHDFHREDTQFYVGPLPERRFWGGISDGDWTELCSRYVAAPGESMFETDKPVWDLRSYMAHYCKQDCVVLGIAVATWRFIWLEFKNVDPLIHSTTAASLAYHVFRSNYVDKDVGIPSLRRFHEQFARQSYSGGRTEPFAAFMEAVRDGALQYFDVTSLYPSVMFFDILPNKPPTTYVTQEFLGAMDQGERAQYEREGYKLFDKLPHDWEEYQGVVQVRVSTKSAEELPVGYIPPIGFRATCFNGRGKSAMDRKFLFSLIPEDSPRTLVITMPEFRHITREEPDVYKVHRIDRIDLHGRGTHSFFQDYIREVYLLKERCTKPPQTHEAQQKLVRDCKEIDIPITLEQVQEAENKGMRAVAKLLLNSLYGKFAQRSLPKTEYHTFAEYHTFLRTKIVKEPLRYRLLSRTITPRGDGEHTVTVKYLDLEGEDTLHRTNVCLAAHITAHARLRLHKMLRGSRLIGCQPVYCDTDSVVFCDPKRRSHAELARDFKNSHADLELGDVLGCWKTEYEEGEETLLEAVQVAAKTYSHKVRDHTKGCDTWVVKSKGMPVKARHGRETKLLEVDPDTGETRVLFDINSPKDWHEAYKKLALSPVRTLRIWQKDGTQFRSNKDGTKTIEEGTKGISRTGLDKRVFDESNPSAVSKPFTAGAQTDAEHPTKKARMDFQDRGASFNLDPFTAQQQQNMLSLDDLDIPPLTPAPSAYDQYQLQQQQQVDFDDPSTMDFVADGEAADDDDDDFDLDEAAYDLLDG